jgi:glycosyltransferase involved in cell wall biosynthesis
VTADATIARSVLFEGREILADDGRFALRFLGDVAAGDVFLTIDVYDLDRPVHPEGHVGWWRFPVEALGERCEGRLRVGADGANVEIAGVASEDRWVNPAPVRPSRCLVHATLRAKTSTRKIVSIDHVPWLADAQDLARFRARFARDGERPRFAAPGFVAAAGATVRIVSPSIRFHDAVGELCLGLYRMLRQHSVAVALYADDVNLEINDIVTPVARLPLDAGQNDTLLYFYSVFDPRLAMIANLPFARKIAYYHGVTAPRLLLVFDPEASVACKKAIAQLPELARFDLLAANSAASAAELAPALRTAGRDDAAVAILPPCLCQDRPLPPEARPHGSAQARFLFVGRLKANKRIEHLLALFAAYRARCPDAQCFIAGTASNKPYRDYLSWVEEKQLGLPAGAVHWLGEVSDEERQRLYRTASVYVSMSEHEGFCLPVLEAMAAGLPVMAYALPAIEELLAGSGLLFAKKDYAALAERLRALLDDDAARADLVAQQSARAAVILAQADGAGFWRLLDPARIVPAQRSSNASSEPVITDQLP